MSQKSVLFYDKTKGYKSMKYITDNVINRINGYGRGSVFYSGDFKDLGTTKTVNRILERLSQKGKLKRLSPGIYYFQKKSQLLGVLSPRIDKIAAAVARKNNMKILISESLAANLLSLTTQVPAKNIFLTDGKTKTFKVDNQTIYFKHSSPKAMGLSKRKSGVVAQALKFFGKDRIDSNIIATLKQNLPDPTKADLPKCKPFVPDWACSVIDKIIE